MSRSGNLTRPSRCKANGAGGKASIRQWIYGDNKQVQAGAGKPKNGGFHNSSAMPYRSALCRNRIASARLRQ